ncbi:acetyl-CoA carboxylase biotin carboxyl carrier protein [Priestia megaterium]|jgi:acetyl-CoA carboxylase biotin carboxyl carrier protein|uniref:acetyl-CoA carboxylase biotin carboxyl carrier protein n=1 Tax=Priestia megaterium TaxID=1404 RepID=UPI002452C72F|nr:acetyl-CoA carboxylase biotin carboxyl carrier protein [Priestia megaterium]MDH3140492.1 acetyl-CoA carboxylase biotin carboxyl carrier protein [Priestia megaterium]MED4238968.1 acetyl-CoA carboxylase biotin carboxyl carrier protein [Priestia megaterium]MED4251788.1 acetyl-CoA carboxylase biotin carboxyl carrier protein [Priestia megaterium]MED4264469.1 acetyl-CoA carboxylase biotin carboxyl carrier protein [Priestia megaterium]MED4277829.1 acetyl-CoA carboxylase biotin carboxyl carrier pro
MLKIQEIREIIKLVDQSSIEEFTYEHEGSKIKMKKKDAIVSKQAQQVVVSAPEQAAAPAPQAAAAPAPAAQSAQPKEEQAAPAVDESLHKITSPMVGTFYASSSPESDVYVTPGDKVQKDSVVCIVEAMKLFNEIEAEVKGEIVDVLVENGQLVEYGQPLFLVKPE